MDKQQTQCQLIPKTKWKMLTNSLKIPKSECPDIWIRLPRHKWPKLWSSMEDPVVPLEQNLYGHLLAGLLWERQFEKIQLKHDWEKIPNWECLFVHREKSSFLSVQVDDIKNCLKRNKILIRCENYSVKKSIWENPSSLEHIHLGNTQRQCQLRKDVGQSHNHLRIANFCRSSRSLFGRTNIFLGS